MEQLSTAKVLTLLEKLYRDLVEKVGPVEASSKMSKIMNKLRGR